MARFATMAEEHWRRWKPRSYAQLADKDAFFRELEDEADYQIEVLTAAAAEADRQDGETFADTMGRFRTARFLAEAEVTHDLILIDPDPA